jgi:hypothetical protein
VSDQISEKPLLITASRARRILDVGNTKFWGLVKSGRIQMAEVGKRRLVVYASIEALAKPIASGDDA